jgi:hypothetical protein
VTSFSLSTAALPIIEPLALFNLSRRRVRATYPVTNAPNFVTLERVTYGSSPTTVRLGINPQATQQRRLEAGLTPRALQRPSFCSPNGPPPRKITPPT